MPRPRVTPSAEAKTDFQERGVEHADSQPDRVPATLGRCLDDARTFKPANVAPLDRSDRVRCRVGDRRLRACHHESRRGATVRRAACVDSRCEHPVLPRNRRLVCTPRRPLGPALVPRRDSKLEDRTRRPKFYFAMILLLAVGTNGVFMALDFVLFYVFWELVLVPMYFLIAVWGGERRAYAAVKFFLYTMLGAVMMLVGILALYLHPKVARSTCCNSSTAAFPRLPVVGVPGVLPRVRGQGARSSLCTRGCPTRTSKRLQPHLRSSPAYS